MHRLRRTYNGVWKGKYIDFEAKETKNKTSFPLSNIHEHQIQHMKSVTEQDGIAFLIVKFSSLDRYFIRSLRYPVREKMGKNECGR